MGSTVGEGIGSPAIEQDPSVAQLQAAQVGAQQAIAVALPASGFVASINTLSGLITFASGANISVTNDGVGNFTFSVIGLGGVATAKTNIAAGAPSPSNDSTEGYAIFSIWIDNTIPATPTIYMCSSAIPMLAIWTALN